MSSADRPFDLVELSARYADEDKAREALEKRPVAERGDLSALGLRRGRRGAPDHLHEGKLDA
jgi:hypothetical protein